MRGVHGRAGDPSAPGTGRRGDGGADHHLNGHGLGDGAPLGHGQIGAADADGHDGRAGAGRKEGGAFHEVLDHRTLATGAFGEQDEALAALEDLFGPLQRLAVGRLAVHGEDADVEEQLAQPLVLPQGVLGHEEQLAPGAEGGEPEVGEGAVDGGQDDRPGGRHVLACPRPWAGTTACSTTLKMTPHDAIGDLARGLDGELLVPARGRGARVAARNWQARFGHGCAHSHDSTSSTTSCTVRPVVSRRCASAAWVRGEAARVESMRSRRATPAADSSWRRRARSSGDAVR